MKKLYASILLVLLPSCIYLVFFYANDPHGYFGSAKNQGSQLIDNMLDWKREDYDACIIGDSRMMSFDSDYIRKIDEETGFHFKNLAYPGAMGEEMNYLINWCLDTKHDKVKSIIIVTGWYNFNELLQQNRVLSTEKIIENPFSYAFSISNMKDMIACFNTAPDSDRDDSLTVTPEEKRKHFAIELEAMSNYLRSYKTDESVINDFISVCNRCKDNNIEIKLVIPPLVAEFYDELDEFGISDIDGYKASLCKYIDIYDMEFEECPLTQRYDDFSDYSHFHGETYKDFSNELIYESLVYSRFWSCSTLKNDGGIEK